MSMTLFIKGTLKAAKRAAARRGIPVRCQKSTKYPEAICTAPCNRRSAVSSWYSEKEGKPRKGRGAAPGTLLFYHSCRA